MTYLRQHTFCIIFFVFCFNTFGFAQSQSRIKWWHADSIKVPFIEGQYWPEEVMDKYDRLPARAKEIVPTKLWNLSKHSAGEMIRFATNAKEIIVKYAVHEELSKFHMPATGVSGVDLYAMDSSGNPFWIAGKYQFKDTIEYIFSHIDFPDQASAEANYQLYLPLYNSIKWLTIGVQDTATFQILPVRSKPIVAYGTSIIQGGCASRPGLAWTAILGRNLNQPVINLGFSGSGKMEPKMTDLVNEIDAGLFILDCMPNLTNSYAFPDHDVENRFSETIYKIQKKHPGTPIILTEHSGGFAANYLDTLKANEYKKSSELIAEIFYKLKKNGVKNIYLLTGKEIGFDINSTVDGLHPNDIGMMKYAKAYENKIRTILQSDQIKYEKTYKKQLNYE